MSSRILNYLTLLDEASEIVLRKKIKLSKVNESEIQKLKTSEEDVEKFRRVSGRVLKSLKILLHQITITEQKPNYGKLPFASAA